MRCLFSLLAILLLTATTVTHAQSQNFEHQNVIRVKFKKNEAKSLETSKFSRSADNYIITGLPSLDALNQKNAAVNYKRVFSDGGKFAARRRAFGLHLWYEITFDKDAAPAIEQLLADFETIEYVDLTEPIYKKSFQRIEGSSFGSKPMKQNTGLNAVFNDPRVGEQWHYDNTGQSGGTADADIDLAEAWDITTGSSNVIVSIHDGGIDYGHEDLANNMWVNNDELNGSTGVDDDGNGYIDDVYGYNFVDGNGNIIPDPDGHGTHVAGTVAAESNNNVGVAGVAGGSGTGDGARLMSCQVFTSGGGGFAESYAYAADNGSIISQNSWGYTSPGNVEQAVLDAIDYFIANAGYDESGNPVGPMQGGIVIFAAGNSDSSGDYYPGFYDPVLSVASTNHNDQKSWYSNYGSWVDISSPGGETNSVSEEGVLSTLPNDSYGFFQGTSMACPHVSGVAALIVSEYGGAGFTPSQLRSRLVGTTDDIEALNPSYNGQLGSGRMNAFGALLTDDGIAPDAITDLADADVKYDNITLTWTSPVDSDNGSASSYEIRYSTALIDEGNFSSATLVGAIGASSVGTIEEYNVDGLSSNTMYYFAVKSYDFFSNGSDISNVISVTTEQEPAISVTPASLTSDLFSGDTEVQQLTIENTGLGTLDYEIPSFATVTSYNVIKNKPNGSQLAKGEKDLRIGNPVLNGAGDDGDTFGYQWIDSNESGGPAFNWEEISTTGTSLSLSDDDYETVNLPFDFPFYDENKNTIYVSSNGFLTFSSSSASSLSNSTLPFASNPNDLIALLWRDLNPSSGGNVYYLAESDRFIVQFDDVPLFGSGGSYTFQCILYPSGDILIQYLSLSSAISDYTSGIENLDGSLGLEVAFNTIHAEDNLAISITNQSPIISDVSPSSGSLAAGEQVTLDVVFSAVDLNGGTYDDEITLLSNDPNNAEVVVPVTLNVTGSPSIEVNSEINFSETLIGNRDSVDLVVRNNGSDVLDISSISIDDAVFSTAASSFSLNPSEQTFFKVYFEPVAVSTYSGTLTINSNDTTDPSVTVSLTGDGVEPPVIDVSPASMTEDLFTGDVSVRTLDISNTGASGLTYDISINYSSVTSTTLNQISGTSINADNGEHSEFNLSALPVELNDLSGIEIGILSNNYAIIENDVSSRNGNVSIITDLSNLSVFDIVILDDEMQSYSQADLDLVIDYVTSGGKLVIEADNSSSTGNINYLLASTSLSVTYKGFSTETITDILPHPTTDGIPSIVSGSYGMYISGATTEIMRDNSSRTHVAIENVGNGLMMVMGNELFQDFSTDVTENRQYINQTIDWLATSSNWLSLSSESGSIAPASNDLIDITFDATGLNGGIYEAELIVSSNDPISSEVLVPITMNVTGAPDIALGSTELIFDEIFVGQSQLDSILVSNTGTDVLNISSVSNATQNFETSLESNTLAPGQSTYIYVEFLPDTPGTLTDELVINSDDPNEAALAIDLSGTAIYAPEINVSPVSITEDLFTGDVFTKTITISNNGEGDLSYSNLENASFIDEVSPAAGNILPGESEEVAITLNAASLSTGAYQSNVIINSNDPDQPSLEVLVTLNVTGIPIITTSTNIVDFGDTFNNVVKSESVLISNVGSETLTISDIVASDEFIKIDKNSFVLEPGESDYLEVIYSPVASRALDATLSFTSNDDANNPFEVSIVGRSLDPPAINVNRDSFRESLVVGDSSLQDITVFNTGFSDLDFQYSIRYKASGGSNGRQNDAIGFYADMSRYEDAASLMSIGDTLDVKSGIVANSTGMVIIGDNAYVVNYGARQLITYDLVNEEVVASFGLHAEPYGIAFDGNYLWIGDRVGNVFGFDFNGNAVGSFSCPFTGYPALTHNGDNFVANRIFISSPTMYELDASGNEVNSYAMSEYVYNLDYVPSHDLYWAVDINEQSKVYGLTLNNGGAEIVNEFDAFSSSGGYTIAHDGQDLIVADWNGNFVTYDDGLEEHQWVTMDIPIESISPDNAVTGQIKFNAKDLDTGTYEATVVILSNDPTTESIELPIKLVVCDQVSNAVQISQPIEDQTLLLSDEVLSIDLNDVFNSNNNLEYMAFGSNATVASLGINNSVLKIEARDLGVMTITAQAYDSECGMAEDSFDLNVQEVTAITDDFEIVRSIYPIPVDDELTLEGLTSGRTDVGIWNMHGQLIKSVSSEETEVFKIDMRGVKAGIYIIQINTRDNSETKRISVKH